MHITVDNAVALAILAFAWITKINAPPQVANAAGWVMGVLLTLILVVGLVL
jgi:hypothetical protein